MTIIQKTVQEIEGDTDPVRPADEQSVFRQLASVPLSQAVVARGAEMEARIPDDASWMRVLRNWGDPGYFIGAALPGTGDLLHCLQDLGARVEARIGDTPLQLETAHAPYGYAANCELPGLVLRAPPGSVVRIHVTVANLPSQQVELIVVPHWTTGTKDRLFGLAIEEQLRLGGLATALGLAGMIAILIAAYPCAHRPVQTSGRRMSVDKK